MKKVKIFMDKINGEICLSYESRRLNFQDGSTGDWCNQFVLIGVL